MIVGLGAHTRKRKETGFADAVQYLVHQAAGQRLGHGEIEIDVPHAIYSY